MENRALAGVEQVEKFLPVSTLAILGTTLLVIGGQFALMLRPTVQSIRKLTFGPVEINLEYRLDIRTRGEIEQLGREFNQRAANLSGVYGSLEATSRAL